MLEAAEVGEVGEKAESGEGAGVGKPGSESTVAREAKGVGGTAVGRGEGGASIGSWHTRATETQPAAAIMIAGP